MSMEMVLIQTQLSDGLFNEMQLAELYVFTRHLYMYSDERSYFFRKIGRYSIDESVYKAQKILSKKSEAELSDWMRIIEVAMEELKNEEPNNA